jgi:hypothetical protein
VVRLAGDDPDPSHARVAAGGDGDRAGGLTCPAVARFGD